MHRYFFRILILFCLAFISEVLFSQGLVLDDEAYEKLPRQSLYGDGSKSENKALDSILIVDLKPYCPKIKHQGYIGSCVGWASGYSALSIQNAIQKGWGNEKEKISKYAYSAMYIYNQIKITDCDYGARIGDAMKFLKEKGDVLAATFDVDESDCNKEPTAEDLDFAAKNRILDFQTLFSPEDLKKVKVNKTKLSLVQKRPVVIGMSLKKNFSDIKPGEKYWFPEVGNTNPDGAHAMVVVGFDEGKKAFELMNSWGEPIYPWCLILGQ